MLVGHKLWRPSTRGSYMAQQWLCTVSLASAVCQPAFAPAARPRLRRARRRAARRRRPTRRRTRRLVPATPQCHAPTNFVCSASWCVWIVSALFRTRFCFSDADFGCDAALAGPDSSATKSGVGKTVVLPEDGTSDPGFCRRCVRHRLRLRRHLTGPDGKSGATTNSGAGKTESRPDFLRLWRRRCRWRCERLRNQK